MVRRSLKMTLTPALSQRGESVNGSKEPPGGHLPVLTQERVMVKANFTFHLARLTGAG
jgi:hypothetical protein